MQRIVSESYIGFINHHDEVSIRWRRSLSRILPRRPAKLSLRSHPETHRCWIVKCQSALAVGQGTMDYYYTSLVVGLVALVFIALAAIPASMNVSSILRRRRGEVYTRLKKLYEDEDGTASVESQDKQLTAIPCFILVTSTVAGFLVSTAAAALCTGLQKKHTRFCIRNWISFASWVS